MENVVSRASKERNSDYLRTVQVSRSKVECQEALYESRKTTEELKFGDKEN